MKRTDLQESYRCTSLHTDPLAQLGFGTFSLLTPKKDTLMTELIAQVLAYLVACVSQTGVAVRLQVQVWGWTAQKDLGYMRARAHTHSPHPN